MMYLSVLMRLEYNTFPVLFVFFNIIFYVSLQLSITLIETFFLFY
jgi:hypothetical protein